MYNTLNRSALYSCYSTSDLLNRDWNNRDLEILNNIFINSGIILVTFINKGVE